MIVTKLAPLVLIGLVLVGYPNQASADFVACGVAYHPATGPNYKGYPDAVVSSCASGAEDQDARQAAVDSMNALVLSKYTQEIQDYWAPKLQQSCLDQPDMTICNLRANPQPSSVAAAFCAEGVCDPPSSCPEQAQNRLVVRSVHGTSIFARLLAWRKLKERCASYGFGNASDANILERLSQSPR